ncbi:Hypothetical protein, putative [Bodo saltans]|uniref:Uncharacterized protein n=1 Tax=Bodo saltans TaxID=75058 RepID=A0A0S4JVT4_BODSA|nr:Hypothetical protein, putative [Bodo saltans]|eukprot:CUG93511.1 Hypothetical protein, putative [Bodo saltans]
MGCGASAPQNAVAASTKAHNAPPELSGKSKFLAFPITAEITHPVSNDRYMMIAYSPVTPPWAFVVVAKNLSNPTAPLLVKDVTDAELTHEKEAQKVSMSWNIFFKAVASEIARVERGGATAVFQADGSMDLECKISLASNVASKKTDHYRCTLQKVADTSANLFKYIATPLSVLYCKRRTDIVERPDTTKERTFGELEATYVRKQSRLKVAQQDVASALALAVPLRAKAATLKVTQRKAVAQASIMQQRHVSKDVNDDWLKKDIFSCDPLCHAEPLTGTLAPSTKNVLKKDTFFFEHIPVYPTPVQQGSSLLTRLQAAETSWEEVKDLPSSLAKHGQGIGVVAAYTLYRFLSESNRRTIDTADLIGLGQDLERLLPPCNSSLHRRAVTVAGAFLNMLANGRLWHRLALSGATLFTAVLASVGLFVHLDGASNALHFHCDTLLSKLYTSAPQQRHAAACLENLVRRYPTLSPLCSSSHLSSIISCASCCDAPMSKEPSRFLRRCKEIRDFGRTVADRSIACGAALAVIFLQQYAMEGSVENSFVDTSLEAQHTAAALQGVPYSAVAHSFRGSDALVDELVDEFTKLFPEAVPPGTSTAITIVVQATMSF